MNFTCMRCAECCSWRGYVYVTAEEVERLAAHLGIGVYDFTEQYTRLSDDKRRLSLIEKENGECVFLDGKTCRVYTVRPKQCADFPSGWSVEGIEHVCAATIKELNTNEPQRPRLRRASAENAEKILHNKLNG